jgi:dihydrodipicolinate synthase/N-acetylneuraminate lyase
MKIKGFCSGDVLPPMLTMSFQEEENYLAEVKSELEKLNLK